MFRVISKEIILSWSLKNPFMGERERDSQSQSQAYWSAVSRSQTILKIPEFSKTSSVFHNSALLT